MTKYILVGHGGFDQTSGSDVSMVLVPPDTKLQFFSDAGQALVLPRADYDEVAANIWDQLKEVEPPIAARGVTYNYVLTPDTTEAHRTSALNANWGGGEVRFISEGEVPLCHGTADTCPTPKLNVAATRHDELVARGAEAVEAFTRWVEAGATGDLPDELADFAPRLEDVPTGMIAYVAAGVPDERWEHHCNGILGTLGGGGDEILWVACTSFMVDEPELPTLQTSNASGPGMVEKGWVPDNSAYDEIKELNAKNVKDTGDGKVVSIVAGGTIVLIGSDHDNDHADYVRRQTDVEEGQITVTKGGAFSKGRLEITGISSKRALVEQEIERFSDKKVVFS